jgi:phosphoglycerate dehydrogenase-like enzyme
MKNSTPITVTSRSFSRHPTLRSELLEQYSNVTFNDEGKKLVDNDLIDFLKGKEKAITALEKLDETVFAQLPDLKVISKYGVGIDMIDLAAMRRHGVLFGWTKGVNCRSVSELVVSFAITILRHVPIANREVLSGQWRQHVGRQLSQRTVGIVGCGFVGKDLAILLRAFGCRVLAYDIKDFPEFFQQYGVEPASLETVLTTADIVTLHLPLLDSTKNMLSAARLSMLRSEAILINTSRGGLVDEGALKSMLMDGRLAAAAFDVFGVEPPDDLELLNLSNFLVTPHIGGSAEEAILAMGRAAIKGLDSAVEPDPEMY